MQIIFEFDTKYGKFRDALYFLDSEPLPSDADIEAMKRERVDNWIKIVETPPPVVEPEVGLVVNIYG